VLHNDEVDGGGIQQLLAAGHIHHIILSPGPGTPHNPKDIGEKTVLATAALAAAAALAAVLATAVPAPAEVSTCACHLCTPRYPKTYPATVGQAAVAAVTAIEAVHQ
jgi:hypothetical protein